MKIVFTPWLFLVLFGPAGVLGQKTALDSLLQSRQNAAEFRNMLELINEPGTLSGTRFFDYHSGIKKAYLFNGDFQLALTIGGPGYLSGRKHKWVHALQFIPCTRVRLFQNDTAWMDKSKPVRTPSFYPRVYYFFSPEKLWNTTNTYNFYFGLGVAHHSNGQDGTEFVDFTDTVNIYNGSFSESLIGHALIGGNWRFAETTSAKKTTDTRIYKARVRRAYRRKRPFFTTEESLSKSSVLNWRLLYEYHPPYFSNQKFHDKGVYGGNRVIGQFSWIISRTSALNFYEGTQIAHTEKYKKEQLRLTLNTEYITDLTYNSGGYNHLEKIPLGLVRKRLNVSLTAYKRFFNSRYPALFAQLSYYGSDNYNIYFQQSFFQARVGLAFAFFEYRKLN